MIYQGQTIVHKDLAHSIKRVFERIIEETDFPVTGVFPSIRFNWKASRYNVCEAFDWRFVENTKEISDHAFGAAIDINRLLNPWVRKGKLNTPNRPYNPRKRGALHANSKVVRIFKEEGWKWGGDWKISKDRMHFYRPEIPHKYYGKIEAKE